MKPIHIKELDQTFTTKEELFRALKMNESKILSLKRASIYESEKKGQIAPLELLKTEDAEKAEFTKSGYVYPVVNTTNFYDSHQDVHFPGIWNKSAREQNGRIHYVFDHDLKVSSVIAWPSDVNILVKSIPWSYLGYNYPGNTEALIYEIEEAKIENQAALDVFKKRKPVQNSIRMQYETIRLGINSNEKEYAENNQYYHSRIGEIVNRDAVEEYGFFFGVETAKIIKEGSMVLFGSNSATPIIYHQEAGQTTSDDANKQQPGTPIVDYTKLQKVNFFQ